ncbi:hypothetical protein [Emcibacter sp. SYSU 3D8]|uniref:hypothetical protein n=1 Tax=Emcibacter sp. SYSU 3D8 TaxID=3133969 RepID=UPI0031FECACD
MTTRWGAALLAVTALVLMTGCETVETASTIRELDDRVREVLVQQASQNDALVRQVTSDQALAELARQAAHQAQVTEGQTDRITFYRIAAVAYWKAGVLGEQRIGDVVAAGLALCKTVERRPPRDCVAIALALPAAQIESERRELDALEAAARQGQLDEEHLKRLVRVTDRMLGATGRLLQLRPPGTDIAVPPDLRDYVDRQVLLAYCNAGRARAFAIENSRAGLPSETRQEYQRIRSETAAALSQEPICMDRKDIRSRTVEEKSARDGS